MTNEAKPCPFHQEPVYPVLYSGLKTEGTDDAGGWAELECPKCDRVAMADYSAFTEDDAIKAVYELWNTRYKRTCRYTQPDPHNKPGVWNTECGNHVYWNVDNEDCGTPPDFCPKCGAEVVDDD